MINVSLVSSLPAGEQDIFQLPTAGLYSKASHKEKSYRKRFHWHHLYLSISSSCTTEQLSKTYNWETPTLYETKLRLEECRLYSICVILYSGPVEVQLAVMFSTCSEYRQGAVSIIFHKQAMNYVVFCNLRPSFHVRMTGQVTSCYDDVLLWPCTWQLCSSDKSNIMCSQQHYLKLI